MSTPVILLLAIALLHCCCTTVTAIEFRLVPYNSESGLFSSGGGDKSGDLLFQETSGGPWKSVCYNAVTDADAGVLCRFLGYNYDSDTSFFYASKHSTNVDSEFPLGASNISCTANASQVTPTPTNFNTYCTLTAGTACNSVSQPAVGLSCSGSRSGGDVGAFSGSNYYMRVVSANPATTTTTEAPAERSSTKSKIDGVIELRAGHTTTWNTVCYNASQRTTTGAALCRVMGFGNSVDSKRLYEATTSGVAAVGFTSLTCADKYDSLEPGNCSLVTGTSCSVAADRAALMCVEGDWPSEPGPDIGFIIMIVVLSVVGGIIAIVLIVLGIVGLVALCCSAASSTSSGGGIIVLQQQQPPQQQMAIQMQPQPPQYHPQQQQPVVQGTVLAPPPPQYPQQWGGQQQYQQQQQQQQQPAPAFVVQ